MKSTYSLSLTLMFLLTAVSCSTNHKKLIGKLRSDIPPEWKLEGAELLDNNTLVEFRDLKHSKFVFIFKNSKNWITSDALKADSHRILALDCELRKPQKAPHRILSSIYERSSNPERAWLIDLASGKFQSLDSKDVVCHDTDEKIICQ